MASVYLDQLSDGIHSPIDERWIRLSGGQQQRIAIARSLYTNPEVLIFDEATSALDTASEKAIQSTIYGLKREKTLIIVAHRLSTVKECDLIFWFDDGRLREVGPADTVLPQYEKLQLERACLE